MKIKYYLFFLIIFLPLGLYLRYLILSIPLSYDEGQWAYTATLILKGQRIPRDVFTTSPLFIFIPYLLSELLLGHGLLKLRIIGLLWNLFTGIIIFFTAKKIFSFKVGILSFILFLTYSINYQQEGHFLFSAEQISQLPLFISIYFLISFLKNKEEYKIFLSGLFLGITCNIREHYLLLVPLLFVYLFVNKIKQKTKTKFIILFLIGCLASFLFIFFYMILSSDLISYLKGVYIYKFIRMINSLDINNSSYESISILYFRLKPNILLIILALISLITSKKNKKKDFALIIYIVLFVDIVSLLSTGKRLFGHYFLYLTYGLIIPSALGFDLLLPNFFEKLDLIKFLSSSIIFYFMINQFLTNRSYLLSFNLPLFGENYAYKNLILNKEMLYYLNSKDNNGRVLFLGESVANYYYLNRNVGERFPAADYFTDWVYIKNEFPAWFADFKKNPAIYIVSDFGLRDVLVVPEFQAFFTENYFFEKKINQHFIFRFKNFK